MRLATYASTATAITLIVIRLSHKKPNQIALNQSLTDLVLAAPMGCGGAAAVHKNDIGGRQGGFTIVGILRHQVSEHNLSIKHIIVEQH